MKVEILYPEICNLFADLGNIRYLKECLKDAEFMDTKFNEEPRFLSEEINLIYMGPTTEKSQERIIEKLSRYKDKIVEKIEGGAVFLFTGNALEIFGKYIQNEKGDKFEALGIFDYYAVQNFKKRHNSEMIASYEDIEVYGFKSQFSFCYPRTEDSFLFDVKRGVGMNPASKKEGFRHKNFLGTYLIGPFLILNPDFTKKLLSLIGAKSTKLAFEEEMYKALEIRKADFYKNVDDYK